MYVIPHPSLSSSTASLSSSSSFPPPPPPPGPFPAPPPSTKKFRIIKIGTIHLLRCGNVHGGKVFHLVESVTV